MKKYVVHVVSAAAIVVTALTTTATAQELKQKGQTE